MYERELEENLNSTQVFLKRPYLRCRRLKNTALSKEFQSFMNKVFLGTITLVVLVGTCFGQSDKRQRPAALADEPKDNGRWSLASGTSISGELQKSIDVHNVKIGDQITLKTTQSIRHEGSVVIPKGATLIGRVTDVARRTKENSQSRIGMVFDRIEGKGLSMPLSLTLTSITNAAARAQADDTFMSDVSGSSRTTSTSRTSSGGGLLGGVGSTVGSVVNTTTQTVGGVTNTAGRTIGSTTGAVGQTLSGIHISAEGSGSAGSTTTLTSPNSNLRVEKGATFNFRVAN